jgi:hypothetical protein
MRTQRFYFYVFLISMMVGCEGHSQINVTNDSILQILFVGNSLTYTNNLPELVKQEARKQGVDIRIEVIAWPNYALEDHWLDGELQKHVSSETFDFVVVQQGSSSQSDGREMLLDYGARIKALCDQHHTKLAFFMVWPARANWHTFPGVIRNYTEAATATQSILCAVGLEWKQYIDSTSDYSYYGPDQFHPSLRGSQVAAEVIWRTLMQ